MTAEIEKDHLESIPDGSADVELSEDQLKDVAGGLDMVWVPVADMDHAGVEA
jgi:hypothetical protein